MISFNYHKQFLTKALNLNNYGFRVGEDVLSNGTLNNLSYTASLSRNSAGPSLIFPTYGSEFLFAAKATLPYSLFNDKDYDNFRSSRKIQMVRVL